MFILIVAAVDTLHLFPETLEVAAAVEAKYAKPATWFKPLGAETRAEFEGKFGEMMPMTEQNASTKTQCDCRGCPSRSMLPRRPSPALFSGSLSIPSSSLICTVCFARR